MRVFMTSLPPSEPSNLEGFRPLTADEISLVAGGNDEEEEEEATEVDDVIVTGPGSGDDDNDYGGVGDGFDDDLYSDDPPEDETPDEGMTEGETEALKKTVEGLLAMLEANYKEHGDAIIALPDGSRVLVSELIDALGKTMDMIEAGTLAYEAATGNLDLIKVAGFLAGVIGGAAAAAAGAGPVAVFVAGAGAGMATEYVLTELAENIGEAYDEAYAQIESANPGSTPGQNMIYLIMRSLGIYT